MKVLVAPDSYKGSMSNLLVARQIKAGAKKVYPDAEFFVVPIADGGEGTVEAMIECLGGEVRYANVTNPNGTLVNAKFGILKDGSGIIEMAAASGLPLIPEGERNVMKATTYGTGELIKAVLDYGCRKIYVGIGGSATNDGGVGMAQALGISFQDCRHRELKLGCEPLKDLRYIDVSMLDERIRDTEIIVMSDVTNPLCGKNGAAAIYGPQKGANREQIIAMDECLRHLAQIMKEELHFDGEKMSGAGAAGGLGLGMAGFLGAKMKSGIQVILEAAAFDDKLNWADLVITGEGKIDGQTICGKAIDGIAKKARKKGVPVLVISGSIGQGSEAIYDVGVASMEAAVCRPMQLDEAIDKAEELTAAAAERLLRAVETGRNMVLRRAENGNI